MISDTLCQISAIHATIVLFLLCVLKRISETVWYEPGFYYVIKKNEQYHLEYLSQQKVLPIYLFKSDI
jgi:hypothetical protein